MRRSARDASNMRPFGSEASLDDTQPEASHFIARSADVLGGTPVFSGTRVPVRSLLEYLEGGQPLDEFLLDEFLTDSHGQPRAGHRRTQAGRNPGSALGARAHPVDESQAGNSQHVGSHASWHH